LRRWLLPLSLTLILCLLGLLSPSVYLQDTPTGIVKPIAAAIRVRSTPRENGETIDTLDADTPVDLVSRTGDSRWLEVRAGTIRGWVDASYIRLDDGVMETLPVNPDYRVPLEVSAYIHGITGNLRLIYAQGQAMGNRPAVFSKVGDSITVAPHTLHPVGEGLTNLGAYTYLQSVIDVYGQSLARDHNAFANTSLAATSGWTTVDLLDPAQAPTLCQWGETALDCEYRIVRPSIAFIMLGTNDVEHMTAALYRTNMEQIITRTLGHGIIPVLTTIPPRPGYESSVTAFNATLYDLSRAYSIPLIDYYAALIDLPDFGLDIDETHPNMPPLGYEGCADFRTPNLPFGYVMRNLTLLEALYEVWSELEKPV
jgi:lysophospholipase L1-like esterase